MMLMDSTISPIPISDALAAARPRAEAFIRGLAADARIVVFCHFDADGLSAGALFGRGLARMGFTDITVVHSDRGENAFSDVARVRLTALRPDALIVTDLGVHHAGVLPGVPTMFVDHHRPEGEPGEGTIISGYGWDPIPASAWLAYELLAPLADVDDLGWLAAVGTIGDLGEKAPWDALPAMRKRWSGKWLREAVSLTNAARRAREFDVGTPLRMMMTADGPRAIVEDDALGADRLRGYRAQVQEELAVARRIGPVFSGDKLWALIPLDSGCQIHPLIAQQWRTRLARNAVIAANRGYLPGVVAFSSRTARKDLVLPTLLRAPDIGAEDEASFGRGHDQASGGHLPPVLFNRLMDALGFDDRARVPED
jgi:single-stranded-DNA-specific exonuclease